MNKISIISLLFLFSCSSQDNRGSKFTSHIGCPANEIKILQHEISLIGSAPSQYTVSCRGKTFYCTENYRSNKPSLIKCAPELK